MCNLKERLARPILELEERGQPTPGARGEERDRSYPGAGEASLSPDLKKLASHVSAATTVLSVPGSLKAEQLLKGPSGRGQVYLKQLFLFMTSKLMFCVVFLVY